jgi:hypothetical protein
MLSRLVRPSDDDKGKLAVVSPGQGLTDHKEAKHYVAGRMVQDDS